MNATHQQNWIPVALLAGVTYLLIGRLFPQPADHVRASRLAAWIVSGVVYAAHVVYERHRLHSVPRRTALHVAFGVALGAAALAGAAMIHSMTSTSGVRPIWLIALIAWPAITAIPAYLVTLAASAVLARRPLHRPA